MLSIRAWNDDRLCEGYCRREFLRVGSLGIGGLTLPALLAAGAAGVPEKNYLKGRSVVLLFLQGGPSHIEFFDPKMTASSDTRSITGEVQTKLPGITFGGTFPKLAARADRISVLRSYASDNSGHTYLAVTSGGNSMKAAMGAVYSRVVGSNNPDNGIPTNTLILPEAVQYGLKLNSNFETKALPTLTSPGDLGPSFAAFDPSGGGELKQDMELKISPGRLKDRRHLLDKLDHIKRAAEVGGVLDATDRFQQQAFDVITGGIADAFDLSQETPSTIEKYNTSKLFRQEDLQKYSDMSRATNLLGRQMLLARRLCEAGCGFVTVSDCGWDMHANRNSPKNMAGIWPMGGQVDHAVAAFVDDLEERGLSDEILLIVTGEMGRTPKINKNGGRDHWGNLTSLLFAGGGLKMGQVIGQSDRQAGRPATEPYSPQHLMATVMHTLFDVGELRIDQGIPRDLVRIFEDGQPIKPLI